jgi:hypothetical protein
MKANIYAPASWLIDTVPTRFVATTNGQTIAVAGVLESLQIGSTANGLPTAEGARRVGNYIEVGRPGTYRAHIVFTVRNTGGGHIEGGIIQVVDVETNTVIAEFLEEVEIKNGHIGTFELDATIVLQFPYTRLLAKIQTNAHVGVIAANGMFEVLRLGPVATDCAVAPSPTAVR